MPWLNRLSNLIRQRDLNPEIDEELQFHLDARIKDNLADGMTEEEARRDALGRFGSRADLREQTRDANVLVTLETMAQDVGSAARSLRKRPAFTVVALLTLALGIGANTSIFTIVQGVMLRPLAFAQSDRLHVVSYAPASERFWLYPGLADSLYLEFRKANHVFESFATFGYAPVTLTGAGEAVRLPGAQVTTDFFKVLLVNAATRAVPRLARHLRRMVLAHTLRLTVIGLALGAASALALTGLMKTLLFEVTPTDAVTFMGSAAVLLGRRAALRTPAGAPRQFRGSTGRAAELVKAGRRSEHGYDRRL